MITRQQVRDKIAELLDEENGSNEYRRQYYNEDGTITGATSARDDISDDAINSLLTGYFNDTTHALAASATIIVVETAEGSYYNELPTDEDLAVATDSSHDDPFDPSTLASTTVVYDSAIHGAPSGEGVQILSYNLSSIGDFFGDLNIYALIAAAAYELANDELTTQINDLRTQLQNLNILP